jgi:DNA-binding transcriptional LysR family regulator
MPIGQQYLLPLIPKFIEKYPDIQLDLTLTDQVADLVKAKTDIAIRTRQLKASTLIARRIGDSGMTIVASPNYLSHYGKPKTPENLKEHHLIAFNFLRGQKHWAFDSPTTHYCYNQKLKSVMALRCTSLL